MTKISNEQKVLLLEFIEENKKIAQGKLTADWTAKDAARLWEEVTMKLNACSGATKSWKEWRKTWHDIKTNTKGRAAAISREKRKTGGGPHSGEEPTDFQKRVCAIIGPTLVHGLPEATEKTVLFDDLVCVTEVSVHHPDHLQICNVVEDIPNLGDFIECNDEPHNEAKLSQAPLATKPNSSGEYSHQRTAKRKHLLKKTAEATSRFADLQQQKLILKEREIKVKEDRLQFEKEKHREEMAFKREIISILQDSKNTLHQIYSNAGRNS